MNKNAKRPMSPDWDDIFLYLVVTLYLLFLIAGTVAAILAIVCYIKLLRI